jgi:hypothetical protein
MKNYSIVKIGNEYVVRAGDAGVLKVASRRQAVRLVAVAAELLNSQASQPADSVASIAADSRVTPDAIEVP